MNEYKVLPVRPGCGDKDHPWYLRLYPSSQNNNPSDSPTTTNQPTRLSVTTSPPPQPVLP